METITFESACRKIQLQTHALEVDEPNFTLFFKIMNRIVGKCPDVMKYTYHFMTGKGNFISSNNKPSLYLIKLSQIVCEKEAWTLKNAITAIRDGSHQLYNDNGNVKVLRDFLKATFPEDLDKHIDLYFKVWEINPTAWRSSNTPFGNVPIIKLSEIEVEQQNRDTIERKGDYTLINGKHSVRSGDVLRCGGDNYFIVEKCQRTLDIEFAKRALQSLNWPALTPQIIERFAVEIVEAKNKEV